MPSTSVAQKRFFGWLSHNPIQAAAEGIKTGMTKDQMRDFAATPEKGLPFKVPKPPSPPPTLKPLKLPTPLKPFSRRKYYKED
jgi:hypothetical protein